MRSPTLAAAAAIVVTTALAASLLGPAPRSEALGSAPDFDLMTYLNSGSALDGAVISAANVSATLVEYTARDVRFTPGAPLGYKAADLINSSQVPQNLTTVAAWVADARATSYTNKHTFAVGYGYETQLSVKLGPFEGSSGSSINLDYSWTNEENVTTTETTTLIMSPQTVTVPAGSAARVEEWYERGTLDARIDLVGALHGTVRITRCGVTADIPLGQLIAARSELSLPELPEWMWPAGDSLHMSNTVDFTTTRATTQLVRITMTPLDSTSSTTTTRRLDPAPVSVPPVGPARGPKEVTRVSPQTRDSIAKLVACTPITADGAVILGADSAAHDPAWGSAIPHPSSVQFTAISGTNAPGQGLYVSALTADGSAYWSERARPFTRVVVPTSIIQTADGSALLGSNGLVYEPAGRRIPSPSGVRFTDVSGYHAPGRSHGVVARATDGTAYASDSVGALKKVPVSVAIVDTADGVALLGADGNIYTTSGKRIANPAGARFVAVSAAVKIDAGIVYSAIDDRGRAFWSANGSAFVHAPLPTRATQTVDGCALLGANGQIYDPSGKAIPNPSGVRFVAVSGLHDIGTAYYISAITENGAVYWSNNSGPFTEVSY